ncbi:hypothetical protein PBI_NINA_7 [Gordonia phage Nina]|uniref:Uncharacterized protein n=1 Tax=Gordonia phage Nina TaxID=2499026 RepID=A0A3S9UNC0_9CAUD|nr:hypothetical protein PBI_NINA_7 [Gordonia phage Nina]
MNKDEHGGTDSIQFLRVGPEGPTKILPRSYETEEEHPIRDGKDHENGGQ